MDRGALRLAAIASSAKTKVFRNPRRNCREQQTVVQRRDEALQQRVPTRLQLALPSSQWKCAGTCFGEAPNKEMSPGHRGAWLTGQPPMSEAATQVTAHHRRSAIRIPER